MSDLDFPPALGHASPNVAPNAQPYRWLYKRFLGSGTFGHTYLVYDPRTGREAAVKILRVHTQPHQHNHQHHHNLQHRSEGSSRASTATASSPDGFSSSSGGIVATDPGRIAREIESMSMVSGHCSFPSLIEEVRVGEFSLVFMEYCDLGDLARYLRKLNSSPEGPGVMAANEVMITFVQVLMALNHLHARGMIHRDLKAANVLLTSRGLVKLGDFGLAAVNQIASTLCGTPEYMAPEQWASPSGGYTSKVDMWAAGVMLYEMLARRRPFDRARGDRALSDSVRTATFPPLKHFPHVAKHYDQGLVSIVEQLLQPKPEDRPSASELLCRGIFATAVEEFVAGLVTAADAGQISPAEYHNYVHCLWVDGVVSQLSQASRQMLQRGFASPSGSALVNAPMSSTGVTVTSAPPPNGVGVVVDAIPTGHVALGAPITPSSIPPVITSTVIDATSGSPFHPPPHPPVQQASTPQAEDDAVVKSIESAARAAFVMPELLLGVQPEHSSGQPPAAMHPPPPSNVVLPLAPLPTLSIPSTPGPAGVALVAVAAGPSPPSAPSPRTAFLLRMMENQERRERAMAIVDPFFDGLNVLKTALQCTLDTLDRSGHRRSSGSYTMRLAGPAQHGAGNRLGPAGVGRTTASTPTPGGSQEAAPRTYAGRMRPARTEALTSAPGAQNVTRPAAESSSAAAVRQHEPGSDDTEAGSVRRLRALMQSLQPDAHDG